jgi:hypothetical protein
MFDALSFTEIDGQHAELLPARTVMSVFLAGGQDGGNHTTNCVGLINGNVLSGLGVGAILGLGSGSASGCDS